MEQQETPLCYFCESRPPDPKSVVDWKLYRLIHYQHLVVVRTLKHAVLVVPIPRCAHCEKTHKKARKVVKIPLYTGIGFGFLVGLAAPPAAPFTMAIFGGVGYAIGKLVQRGIYRANPVKRFKKSVIASYPEVAILVREGWRLEK